ncbi:hypothetical protein [Conexibacter sp. CPCC 206217]|uniref:hypothetical protein n=1 Tax=Conexibacter sp. CPCC 206217 TaxID=3064574 RepID=UPI00272317B1|nr:hypothetical protein [Conexibacter sp. CPCC 206217]MDO8213361.1 hypothetical protein [Conexibacter sp. CPCC 206217]
MSFDSADISAAPRGPSASSYLRELGLWDAWVFAAGDAARALGEWHEATPADAAVAYAVYRAALDREERAAAVLAECVTDGRQAWRSVFVTV